MKKRIPLKRGLALCLALMMTLSLSTAPASASEALGSSLLEDTYELASGVRVTEGSLWSASKSDLRTEYYLTYTPGSGVTPTLWYGAQVDERQKLTVAAGQLAEQGVRVVAGMNGGYFNGDGSPVGLVLTDGIVRSMDRENYCMLGFDRDGRGFFDESPITKTVSWTDWQGLPVTLEVAAVNASRMNGLLYLYTDDYGPSTQNTYDGVDVVLVPEMPGEKPTMDCHIALTVVQVTDSTLEDVAAENVIPEGCYVLSANKNCDEALLNALRTLLPGTRVTLDITGGDPRWAGALCGLTALYPMVRDGEVVTDGLSAGASPRTAVGLREDGTVIFYVIDGRQPGYSVGANYQQVAQRLIELGCVQASSLDGGGSATLGASLPGTEELRLLSRPSGGSQRAVCNCLFLVTAAPSTGRADRLFVTLEDRVVLAGSSTRVAALAADVNGYPVTARQTVSYASTGGTVTADGEGGHVFTAGSGAGLFEVGAAAGNIWGSARVRVVEALSALTVTREDTGMKAESMDLLPGEELELNAAGSWWNLPVAMSDRDVTWTVEGGVGVIDEDGHFTASLQEGTGAITAAAGEKSVVIQVEVKRNDPFTDLAGHWSRPYVLDLYDMGMVNGVEQEDGTFQYQPDNVLTRGEVLTYLTRLIGADTALYEDVELPFADLDQVRDWQVPYLKAMYALGAFKGDLSDGVLSAKMDEVLTRESILTLLGRVVAEQVEYSLDELPDADLIHSWCLPYIQTLAAYGIVNTTAALSPQAGVTRGEMATLVSPVSRLPLITPGEAVQTP